MRLSSLLNRTGCAIMPFCVKCGAELFSWNCILSEMWQPLYRLRVVGSSSNVSGLPPHPQETQIPCTTAFSISGCRIVKELGIVRGLTVGLAVLEDDSRQDSAQSWEEKSMLTLTCVNKHDQRRSST